VRIPQLIVTGGFVAAALLLAAPAGATNECRGLSPCIAIAGPWVVVPATSASLRVKAQFELACPRGWIVGGTDAELTDRAIDLAFFGGSGSPVAPGITTSRTILFAAGYAGTSSREPTFRPHIGCIPATGGGRRTPTAVTAVFPPGAPTERRVVNARVSGTRRVVAACHADERLVDWYASRAFDTQSPPSPALVAGLSVAARAAGRAAVAVARATRGQGIVQVGAVCAGGR
jgi:hypothetical protein